MLVLRGLKIFMTFEKETLKLAGRNAAASPSVCEVVIARAAILPHVSGMATGPRLDC